MRKFVLVIPLFALCVSCGNEAEENTVVCSYNGTDSEVNIEQTIRLRAIDDEIQSVEDSVEYTFEDIERYQSDIDAQALSYKQLETCADPLDGKSCSENVKFTWSQEENVLSTKTVSNIAKAIEEEENLSIFEEFPKSSYISLKETKQALESQQYKCKQK